MAIQFTFLTGGETVAYYTTVGTATNVITSGGTIILQGCTVTGVHAHYHGSGEYPSAAFSTVVDTVPAVVIYPNCPSGCTTYGH